MMALAWGRTAALAAAFLSLTAPALAAGCHKEPNFAAWLDGVRKEAASLGLSRSAINSALGSVTFDPAIVKKDRAQGVFTQDFLQFSDRMVSGYRLTKGPQLIAKYKNTFAGIEKAVWRAGAGAHRLLGAGNGFRRLHRRRADADLAGDACL